MRLPKGRPKAHSRRDSGGAPWASWSDERLLETRICDLGLKIEGTALEERVEALYSNLEDAGLRFRPHVWLSDEWFCPDGVPGIAGLEVNISCPNINEGGRLFADTAESASAVTRACKAVSSLPLMVKLSPNVGNIVEIAQAVEAAGADSISVANTLLGMLIDVDRRRPYLANRTGGLSGPAVRPGPGWRRRPPCHSVNSGHR